MEIGRRISRLRCAGQQSPPTTAEAVLVPKTAIERPQRSQPARHYLGHFQARAVHNVFQQSITAPIVRSGKKRSRLLMPSRGVPPCKPRVRPCCLSIGHSDAVICRALKFPKRPSPPSHRPARPTETDITSLPPNSGGCCCCSDRAGSRKVIRQISFRPQTRE